MAEAQSHAPASAAASAPPATSEQQTSRPRKRMRRRLPGIRAGSRWAGKPALQQLSALWEAEALDCDPDDLEDPQACRGAGGFDMGGWWVDSGVEAEIERMQHEAVLVADRELRARATHEQWGHGNERLAQLEELLSHDMWEPAGPTRVTLWREHRLLLEADPQLRSHLAPPADVEQSAIYWEPPLCALCSCLLDGNFDFDSGDYWCMRCAAAEAAEAERLERQA